MSSTNDDARIARFDELHGGSALILSTPYAAGNGAGPAEGRGWHKAVIIAFAGAMMQSFAPGMRVTLFTAAVLPVHPIAP